MMKKMLVFNFLNSDQVWSSTVEFDNSFVCAGKCAYVVYADGVCVGKFSNTHSAARDPELVDALGLDNAIKIDEAIRQF